MNKVDSKRKDCAPTGGCEPPSNGSKCELQQSVCDNIEKIKLKTKALNGVVNGTDVDVVHEEHPPMAKTDTSQADTTKVEGSSEEKETKQKKAKKKRNKNDIHAESNSHPCLLDDFDITSIIRDKYKQEAGSSDEKLKIVVNHFEKIELKDDKSTVIPDPELPRVENPTIEYVAYQSELQMPLIMKIIQKDLSEPYSIYTYRYFIHNWPNLCFLAMHESKCVGAIVCKLDMHRKVIKRGYIAMLAVDKQYRKHGLGSTLVKRAIQEMIAGDADEVVLETEITNRPALRLYEALGFVRDKRLFRYYLNGVDALRLKLWLR